MECLYIPELDDQCTVIQIPEAEAAHCKALRLRDNELILVSNGKGLCCTARVLTESAKQMHLVIMSVEPMFGESARPTVLALAMLENKDRFEFAVEKAVELGVQEILIMRTRYASKRPVHLDRVRAKTISALKQCKRSVLPTVQEVLHLADVVQSYPDHQFILGDASGSVPQAFLGPAVVCIGPEGGFDETEIQLLGSTGRIVSWKLGESRLRSETAAIAALSMVQCVGTTV